MTQLSEQDFSQTGCPFCHHKCRLCRVRGAWAPTIFWPRNSSSRKIPIMLLRLIHSCLFMHFCILKCISLCHEYKKPWMARPVWGSLWSSSTPNPLVSWREATWYLWPLSHAFGAQSALTSPLIIFCKLLPMPVTWTTVSEHWRTSLHNGLMVSILNMKYYKPVTDAVITTLFSQCLMEPCKSAIELRRQAHVEYDSLSADDLSRRGLMWQGPICASKHILCLGLCKNSSAVSMFGEVD